MRVIAWRRLREYAEENPGAKAALEAWYHEAAKASWENPAQIKEQYRSASILKASRVVFNIAGNNYRLVTAINFSIGIVYIKFVGTHKEYDEVDAETIEHVSDKTNSE